MSRTFHEFFAGAGMARCGLGAGWQCLFANDIDEKKAACYVANFGAREFRLGDVATLGPTDPPGAADLAWASFPCQDLSLAGAFAGLAGERSGTFWPFWRLIEALGVAGRAPSLVALENVAGALRAREGRDFATIIEAIARSGYRPGAMIIDAKDFLPQSRPRLFIVAARDELEIPPETIGPAPDPYWTTRALCDGYRRLGPDAAGRWLWWTIPAPRVAPPPLATLIDRVDAQWHTGDATARLLGLMNELNLAKVAAAQRESVETGKIIVGTIYRRTRADETGMRRQRAEVRFDGIAGCIRTPAGGSSRQTLIVIERGRVRTRLIAARETARLMGLPETFTLPERYNDAYHATGDGVAVPVVRHLAENLLEPILAANNRAIRAAQVIPAERSLMARDSSLRSE